MKRRLIFWVFFLSAAHCVMAQDSAVLKSFMTASGGSGMMYQYEMRYDVRIRGTVRTMVDTMSSAISDDGYTRVDMAVWGMRMVVLRHAGQPGYSVILNPQTLGYRLNIIDTAVLNGASGQTFQVTKIGTEMVGGYSCIHAKMIVIGETGKLLRLMMSGRVRRCTCMQN